MRRNRSLRLGRLGTLRNPTTHRGERVRNDGDESRRPKAAFGKARGLKKARKRLGGSPVVGGLACKRKENLRAIKEAVRGGRAPVPVCRGG